MLWILDIVLPLLSIGVIFGMYLSRKCDLAILLAWWAGLALGLIWEYAFFFAGDDFSTHKGCHVIDGARFCLRHNPLPDWYISLGHSLEDAGIFMLGVALAWYVLGGNKKKHFTHWHWGEVALIWVVGVAIEYAVVFIENTRAFLFFPQTANPAYFTTSLFSGDGQEIPYTIVPDAIWWVVPFIFYAILLGLKRKWGGIRFGDTPAVEEGVKSEG